MRKFFLTAGLCLCAAAAPAAPVYLDGSNEGVAEPTLQQLTMALVKEGARDANSAEYHSLKFIEAGGVKKHLCGYVNLKNGFGAYAGFMPFQMDLNSGLFKMMTARPGEPVYELDRLPFKWSGCAKLLEIPEP